MDFTVRDILLGSHATTLDKTGERSHPTADAFFGDGEWHNTIAPLSYATVKSLTLGGAWTVA